MTSTFLHDIGDTIRNAMATVPLSLVGWAFVAIPLVLRGGVRKCPIGDDENRDPKQVRLLRIGAALALVLQIVIYGLL